MRNYDLTEKQVELLNYVMLPKALRPHRKFIIAKLGIKEDVYYDWLRLERFNLARRDFIRQYFYDDIPDVLMAMKDEAMSGNPVAAKLFLEFVDGFGKEATKSTDPLFQPKLPVAEVKIIINKLQQKFYGKNFFEEKSEPIEGEISAVIEA